MTVNSQDIDIEAARVSLKYYSRFQGDQGQGVEFS